MRHRPPPPRPFPTTPWIQLDLLNVGFAAAALCTHTFLRIAQAHRVVVVEFLRRALAKMRQRQRQASDKEATVRSRRRPHLMMRFIALSLLLSALWASRFLWPPLYTCCNIAAHTCFSRTSWPTQTRCLSRSLALARPAFELFLGLPRAPLDRRSSCSRALVAWDLVARRPHPRTTRIETIREMGRRQFPAHSSGA